MALKIFDASGGTFMGCRNDHADIMAMHPEVTGSCNLVIAKLPDGRTTKFGVDCGMFQEREHEELNDKLPFDPEEIEFCLVTHNHVDHIGRLPFMIKNGFRGKIYTTETTSKLLPLALRDSYKVLRDTSKRRNKKLLYNEEHVAQTEKLIVPCKYDETIFPAPNIKVKFLSNGHLVGAAMILVQISYPDYDDINILFTGDYNNKNIFFDVKKVPEYIREMPITIVQESTYGYMDSSEMEKTFEKNVLHCLDNDGTVVVPVFSLGRAQEILYEVKCMQDSGSLATDIPVYFDGKLAMKYTELYIKDGLDNKPEMRDFLPKNLRYVDKMLRPSVLRSTNKKIIITTSGMGSYGPAQVYIPEYITRKNCLIQFTGYCAEGTLGYRLKTAKQGESVEVGGLVVKKYAQVEYTTEYSAHAKADEMIDFLKQFRNLKLVLVNHGQSEVKKKFAERIYDEVQPKRVGILGEDYFFRVNPYGLQKTLSINFE